VKEKFLTANFWPRGTHHLQQNFKQRQHVNTVSASARPSQVEASLNPPPLNDIPDNHDRKASVSFVHPLRCTPKAELENDVNNLLPPSQKECDPSFILSQTIIIFDQVYI
jgi:hypothetical protein